jgi:hypothetical protein
MATYFKGKELKKITTALRHYCTEYYTLAVGLTGAKDPRKKL